MKNTKTIIAITALALISIPILAQDQATTAEVSNYDGFFSTFFRTPFAFAAGVSTFICVLFVGLFESIGFLISGFDYKWPITQEIIEIGWFQIVRDWWWEPARWWHALIGLIFWPGIIGGGKKARRKKY